MRKTNRAAATLLGLLWAALAWSETPAPPPDSTFERLRAGDPETLAIYERKFEEAQDPEEKSGVAMFLAEAGQASDVHVRFLETRAREAVQSPRPFPFVYQANWSDSNQPEYAEDFKAWVESISGDLEEEARRAMFEQPARVIPLRPVEGPSVDEILLMGLRSPNLMVRIASLRALVDHGHADALPAMLDAIHAMPEELHQVLGMELLRLLDERANEAARELIGDDRIYEETLELFRPKADPR